MFDTPQSERLLDIYLPAQITGPSVCGFCPPLWRLRIAHGVT
jgi:hypothetical protein